MSDLYHRPPLTTRLYFVTKETQPLALATAQTLGRQFHDLIVERTGSRVALIPEVARYLMHSGGKRLRPMVTIAAAAACGYEGEGDAKLAASVEFMHTATLFHDDVVDESETRRGRTTARLVWGNQESVLVGDYLLGQAFKMMVEVGSLEALAVLSSAAAVIASGPSRPERRWWALNASATARSNGWAGARSTRPVTVNGVSPCGARGPTPTIQNGCGCSPAAGSSPACSISTPHK